MDNDERILKSQLKQWQVASPAPGSLDAIMRAATSLPQHRPWWQHAASIIESACTDWRYGLSYKLAGLAVCAVIGLTGGMLQATENTMDIASLSYAGGDYDMMEGI